MTSRDFCYWLQGFFEVQNPKEIDTSQVEMIKRHLNMVFVHEIDPSMGNEEHQTKLNNIHNSNDKDEEDLDNWLYEKYGATPPKPGWKLSIHGWYDPNVAVPRC